jgi:hypothetical protein
VRREYCCITAGHHCTGCFEEMYNKNVEEEAMEKRREAG